MVLTSADVPSLSEEPGERGPKPPKHRERVPAWKQTRSDDAATKKHAAVPPKKS